MIWFVYASVVYYVLCSRRPLETLLATWCLACLWLDNCLLDYWLLNYWLPDYWNQDYWHLYYRCLDFWHLDYWSGAIRKYALLLVKRHFNLGSLHLHLSSRTLPSAQQDALHIIAAAQIFFYRIATATDVWATDVWTTDIWTIDVWTTDVFTTDDWNTDNWTTNI